ncbi:MAG: SLC13/DASS family transporter [Phycisphaerae bacterium]|nr:SLC13/DASS family transporter [Phycisphaerae bacterium]
MTPLVPPVENAVAERHSAPEPIRDEGGLPGRWRIAAMFLGPVIGSAAAFVTWDAIGSKGAIVLGVLTLMAIWWLTLAVELAATALLPVVLLPSFGISTFAESAAPYADGVIFLFAGGFVMAIALERHGLSERFAHVVVGCAGHTGANIVGAIMVATAALSAFVSNTATAAVMLPIALALTRPHSQHHHEYERSHTTHETDLPTEDHLPDLGRRRFATAALLGVAYASTIGGVLTLVGSPPNAVAARFIQAETGQSLSFVAWLRFGLPVGLVLLPITWFILTRWFFPCADVRIEARPKSAHRPLDMPARTVLAIFALTVVAWFTRPLWNGLAPGVRDESISITAALLLLALPAGVRPFGGLVTWHDLRALPWAVLILFGGGLSIAAAIEQHGVALWLASHSGSLTGAPTILVLLAITAVTCFASEVASNTALAATAMPVLGALGAASGAPIEGLAVTTALGASLAFMLPVGTPPNAMVYATGQVSPRDMARVGLLLNVIAIAVVTAVSALIN